jgi:hypothetical protein
MPGKREFTAADARNLTCAVYDAVTLFAGDVVFDGVGMLQAGELDGEAVVDMTDHVAWSFADGDRGAHRRPQIGSDRDRGARGGKVDDAGRDIGAVRQDQPCYGIARREAAVAAVFRQIEDLPVGELGGELIALARGRRDHHGKAVVEKARDLAFEPAEMIGIGDHSFARIAYDRRNHGHAARRYVDHLARKFAAIGQHVASEQVDLDALMPPAFLGPRHNSRLGHPHCHGDWHIGRYFTAANDPIGLSLAVR